MAAASSAAATEVAVPAERVRSVLAAASSLSVTTSRCRVELLGRHTVDQTGCLLLDVPVDSPLAAEVACAPFGDEAATLELTDVAPVAVRERVRARVTLAGRLADSGGGASNAVETTLRYETAHAVLEEGSVTRLVPVEELALADPDPLVEVEAELLTHLDGAHPDAVARLARLLEPRVLQNAQCVRPLRLDRHGIVLRVERLRGHHDARLPFATPLRRAEEIWGALQHLLARAGSCPRRRRLS
jgi:hypothetical protein